MKRMRNILIALLAAAMCLGLGLFAAACTKGGVTLTFVAEETAIPSVKTEEGAEVELPIPASREGYAFDGWYQAADYSGEKLSGKITAPAESTKYYGRWVQGYSLTLDFGGGTYGGGQSATLWLAEGDNVYAAVENIVPAKSGLTFGAWFNGDAELSRGLTMGTSALTLTARYLAEYRIDVRLQNISGTAYVADAERTVYGKGYAGLPLSPDAPVIEHFVENDAPEGEEPVTGLTLSEDASQNVYTFYYDRERYSVRYDANAPQGTATGEVAESRVVYEGNVRTAQNGFTLAGYRFAGWSTHSDGEVEYAPGARIVVTAPVTLYAVWDRGYTDRFGGSDLIFFPRGSEDLAILLRGGHEFEGTRTENAFTFDRPAGKITGSVFGLTFSYTRGDVKDTYYLYDGSCNPALGGKPYDDPSRLDTDTTLEIDEFLGAVYTVSGKSESGFLCYSERGDYLFTGDNGTSFHLNFSNSGENAETPRFSIGGEEANVYVEAQLLGNQPFLTGGSLILDGYGNAVLYQASSGFNLGYDGYYVINNEITANGSSIYRVEALFYDPIGGLGNGEGVWVYNSLYTIPSMVVNEMGIADGYVACDVYAGRYENGEETLELDGIGFFGDSAVYTAAGETVKGTYSYTVDRLNGLTVTLTAGTGETLRFLANPSKGTFELCTDGGTEEFIELYRVTGQLDFPLLYLYPESKAGQGMKAELYATEDEGDTMYYAGTGYYTVETLGGMDFYTFTRTGAVEKYASSVPETLRFFCSAVYSSMDNLPRPVYCVLEYNGEKLYTEYFTEDGVTILASNEVTLQGVGSLMRLADGTYIEGSASLSRSTHFNVDILTFLYGDALGDVRAVYTVSVTEDGNRITPRRGEEIALYYYLFIEETQSAQYVQDLVLDGVNRASFNDDYGDGEWQEGTYALVGTTEFGDDIYELTVGGTARFRFAIFGLGNQYIYFRYNEALYGTFVSESGALLTLDGFFYGSFADGMGNSYLGTFSYNPVEEVIFFTATTGEEFYVAIGEGHTCTPLDGAYGTFQLIDCDYEPINNAEIAFDGQGHVTVTFSGGEPQRTGTYTSYNAATNEYIVNCNFGEGMSTPQGGWRVRLLFGTYAKGCIVFEPEMVGTFFNDEWDVLYLDGFGTGSLYSADGNFGGTGEYTLMDEEKGLLYFTFDDNRDVSIIFDRETHTFELIDFSSINYLYLADDFGYIAFRPDGVLHVGNSTGMYFRTAEAYYGFLYDYDTEDYRAITMPVPDGTADAPYVYGGKTYRLWNGEKLLLGGTVEFYGKEDTSTPSQGTKAAQIELTPVIGANYNLDATVTLDGRPYQFLFNPYTGGALAPRLTYDGVDYPVAFTLNGTNKFTVRAGYYAVGMDDYYYNFRDEEGARRGGRITKEVIGFGPIVLNDPTYSGEFYYHNANASAAAEKLTFSGVTGESLIKVGYRVGGLGDCYEIVFRSGNETYAIDFYETEAEETGPCYVLQGFYTYREMQADGYVVGVKYLVYASTPNTPGYGDSDAIGKPYSVTLTRPGEETPVVTYDTGISIGGAVWLVEFLGLSGGNAMAGKGYYVEFTFGDGQEATAVTVREYVFKQAVSSGYFVNFFIDEEGKVAQVIAVAYSDGESYRWLDETHDLTYNAEDDTWSFYGRPGASSTEVKYVLKFVSEGGTYTVKVTAE